MKRLLGQTDHWQFPIMGEETWAGVDENTSSNSALDHLSHLRKPNHVTTSQHIQGFTPV